jgi:uncharacterized membrane protein
MIWLQFFMALPFLYIIGLVLWIKGISGEIFYPSALDSKFYIAFLVSLPLETAATILYVKALRLSPLNLTLPFLSLTPIFLILFSWLILDEKVSMQSGFGIFLIAFGSYILNIKKIKEGFLEPFKAIARERGSIYMIMVAVLFSFTSALGKMGVTHSTPLYFGVTYITALCICLMPFAIYSYQVAFNRITDATSSSTPQRTEQYASVVSSLPPCSTSERNLVSCKLCADKIITKRNLKNGLILGAIMTVSNVMHFAAISISNVADMIAIKRLGLLFGIILGYLFFKETGFKERFTGALIMFIGFVMIVTGA